MTTGSHLLKIKLQIFCRDEIAMGPGKADLLEAIDREGSISAAGRALGMSYRRTWQLVDAMNRCWREPLVSTQTVGAEVTAYGHEVLHHYRALQKQADGIRHGTDWAKLESRLLPAPKQHQKQD